MNTRKKLAAVCAAVFVVLAGGALAETNDAVKATGRPHRSRVPGEARLRNFGEKIEKEGSGKGKIVFVDASSDFSGEALGKFVRALSGEHRLHMDVVKGGAVNPSTAGVERRKLDANAVIFVVSDDSLPMSLVAFEESWGIANVKKAIVGAPTKIVADERAKKIVFRTFANTCGAGYGMFPVQLMSPVANAEDLDSIPLKFPIMPPIISAICAYMQKAGMELTTTLYYRDACKAGWAPKPRNEIEQAIWDKVHAMPTEPLKIKPETKKVCD